MFFSYCSMLQPGSIYASFTLAAYSWKPGDWQAVTWPFEMISMGSLSFLGPLAGRKRPEEVISFTSVAGMLIHLAQIFAPFAPLALVGPHLCMGFLAFARPVSAAYLSSIFSASQQAKVQALAHLVHDCGILDRTWTIWIHLVQTNAVTTSKVSD